MRVLLFVLLLFPLLELALLIKVGSSIGVLATLLLILLGVLIGGGLLRIAGPATAWRARARLLSGEAPEQEMLDGLLLALAGLLILLPGFISDVLGLLCLLPVTRHLLRQRLARPRRSHPPYHAPYSPAHAPRSGEPGTERVRPQVIEGEWERRDS
ncbi:FxsA family protein [Pseudomonas sp. NW5]|uniref:FxsA family protein n=1 Tax=Pseudomonas sp. NW5 TaxID=2934934 RepID=UPI002022492E|nr:FxsA family protein [Pseudomonas sp. NW5]MCL7461542.1 membrane protein FxsA [Pseudomonas sp. NW5]